MTERIATTQVDDKEHTMQTGNNNSYAGVRSIEECDEHVFWIVLEDGTEWQAEAESESEAVSSVLETAAHEANA